MTQTTGHRTAAPASPASMPWGALLLLAFAAFWTVTLEMLPAGLLPTMTDDLGVRPSQIGLLVTAWSLTVGLTSIPLTRAARRLRGTTTLVLALGVVGSSSILTALAPRYGDVMATRLVAAAGHGLFWSVLMVYAASIAPQGRQARAIAVVNTGPLFASAVGLPLGNALGELVGWRPVVGTVGVAMILGAVALRTSLPDSMSPSVAVSGGWRDPTAPVVLAAALLGALALLAHFAVFTFIATLATSSWRLTETAVSGLLLTFGAMGALGLALAGWVGDRRPQRVLAATMLGIAVLLAVLSVPGKPAAVTFAVVAAWGALFGMLPPLLQNVVIGAASPGYRATAGSVLVATFNLGIASGAAAGGLVIDQLGIDRLLPLAAAASLLAAAGLAALRRRPP